MEPLAMPSSIGARAEAAVASALVRTGRTVYLPIFTVNGRVDLVYCDSHRIVRVQCKSARLVRDALQFATCSNTAKRHLDYIGQVDEFGVYSPDTGMVYLVPLAGMPIRACSLRLTATLNGQASGIRWARDYELGPP